MALEFFRRPKFAESAVAVNLRFVHRTNDELFTAPATRAEIEAEGNLDFLVQRGGQRMNDVNGDPVCEILRLATLVDVNSAVGRDEGEFETRRGAGGGAGRHGRERYVIYSGVGFRSHLELAFPAEVGAFGFCRLWLAICWS